MITREIRRTTLKYGKYAEPFLLLGLIAVFLLPIMTFVNLSPATKSPITNPNVLGVETASLATITKIGGYHNVIQSETLKKLSDDLYNYKAEILPHQAAFYSKPILELKNNENLSVKYTFTVGSLDGNSEFGILQNNTNYILRDAAGDRFERAIDLQPGEARTIYLTIRSSNIVNFNQKLLLNIRLER